MKTETADKLIFGGFIAGAVVVVALVALGITVAFIQGISAPVCLSYGYPETRVTYNLDTYCVKRLDQTDTVVPINQVVGK
jgi:hypothetical protein